MQKSNFNMRFGPTFSRDCNPQWQMCVELTSEFRDFLRRLKVDKKYYEDLAFRTMKKCGWPHITRKTINDNFGTYICGWDGGLITKVQVFGSAAGLYFQDNPGVGPRYSTHNIPDYNHLIPVITVMSHYLFRAELEIPK